MADGGIRRDIPIKLGEFSVIDTEFANIRERFDAEMRKMEDEMSKFRSKLMDRESNNFFKSTTSTHHMTSEHRTSKSTTGDWESLDSAAPTTKSAFDTFSSKTTQEQSQNSSLTPHHDSNTWLDGLDSPLIQDEGGNKSLKLRFDVSKYTPEEIVVKTVDNKLLVHAKHEEKSESKSVYREYNREFLLPKGTNPESIKSSLSKDGVLTVEAPLPLGSGETLIPIAHK
ncbi:alpha-crystallin B chain isoform X1 [Neodiprion pinetum]|uniref:Alpha-crystallin A chain isoform X1 n=1 Tax=Neodiprion lecontei TaxID=441921 RepID=A0A6J0CCG4_NEOLC|nr:alpha-crystallin A chain isoform X1 [Neodiprion lecontei]XP_046431956.1 alpha-crystallin A chain isoform X1 [Neodiprion fabricii]XP_046488067.1 alpha-crystallin A chain isoform X1 [Neodiprion pinetum]XP_046625498.1 alpha-crystallin A chain isoform X1 [Neodiprion virginianus]